MKIELETIWLSEENHKFADALNLWKELTNHEIANWLNVTETTISKWRSNTTPVHKASYYLFTHLLEEHELDMQVKKRGLNIINERAFGWIKTNNHK